MKAIIQRVLSASVEISGIVHSQIGKGFLVLLGIAFDDNDSDIDFLVDKCVNLRIFDDEDGKMNLSLGDVNGELMIVSQFTLLGDARRGRRPSYSAAANPQIAIPIYEKFIAGCKAKKVPVKTGVFGSDMKIHLVNDGPVTIILDSKY
jgi:D-tyrosyl-tRNA(Tyr) deacylase